MGGTVGADSRPVCWIELAFQRMAPKSLSCYGTALIGTQTITTTTKKAQGEILGDTDFKDLLYLFQRQRERKKQHDGKDLPSFDSFSRCLQLPELGQDVARNLRLHPGLPHR